MKKFLLLVLISFCWMSVWATDNLKFRFDDESNTATVIGCLSENIETLILPETVSYSGKIYTVRSIKSLNSIYSYISANSLIIPETVISVSPDAFVSLHRVETITMPKNLDVSEASLFLNPVNEENKNISYHVLNGREIEPSGMIMVGGSELLEINTTTITAGNTFSVVPFQKEVGQWCEWCEWIIPENWVSQELIKKALGSLYFQKDGLRYRIINESEVSVAYFGDGEDVTHSRRSEYKGDIVIPSTITTSQGNTFQVTSIDEGAFCDESVMYEFGPVYTEGSGVTSITFPDNIKGINKAGIHFIKNGIWYRVLNNNDVCVAFSPSYTGDLIIPSTVSAGNTFTVKSIAEYAFASCRGLSSITIPESVTSIGDGVFWGCSNLSSATFGNVDVSSSELTLTKNNITYKVLSNSEVAVSGAESTITDVSIPNTLTAGNIFAVKSIYENAFANCKNIESVTISCNIDFSQAALTFTKNNITYKVLSNSEVAVCKVESTLTDETIPSTITAGMSFSVKSIETNAFSGCNSLKSVVIPETIKIIGESAFAGCSKLAKVTCMATTPPEANKNSFENYNGYLYFPCESKDDYDIDVCWGTFQHKECIASETVELTKDEVTVEPEKNEAVFSMPINESANSYTLTIQNNGVTFCTLTFNAQGQLANIDFSTTKSHELKASVSGYQFTVTGLSEATDYGYSFKALASNKSVLKEYTGSFTTKNADGTGGSTQGGTSTAINSVSNATAVTIANNQIFVNDEAPTFVYTTMGQKIANQNLKSGVYFVNVEGETVKIVK